EGRRRDQLAPGGEKSLRDNSAEVFLAVEIVEEAPLREARCLADFVHRRRGVPLVEHELLGGVEELLSGRGINLGRSHRRIPTGWYENNRRQLRCQQWLDRFSRCRGYAGRTMPSFFILDCKVVRFMSSRTAAPFGPPSTQPVSRRTPRMWS